MPKICIWYIVGNHENLFLDLSLRSIINYNWVHSILIVSDESVLDFTQLNPKIIHYRSSRWGSGLERKIAEGGLNEVGKRNFAIEMAEKTGADWLLQCDADEFYTNPTYDWIKIANSESYDALGMELIDFVTPISILREPTRFGKCNYINPATNRQESMRLYDPHVRAWKANMGINYQQCQDEQLRISFPNETNHCGVKLTTNKVLFTLAKLHCHVHDMMGPKKRAISPDAIIQQDFTTMPEIYKNLWSREQIGLPINWEIPFSL